MSTARKPTSDPHSETDPKDSATKRPVLPLNPFSKLRLSFPALVEQLALAAYRDKLAQSSRDPQEGTKAGGTTAEPPRDHKHGFTAEELMSMDLPEPRWVVPDLLPEGLTLLAGKPKIGKSWLGLSLALNVGLGGKVLGQISVEPGEVLYLALEDTARRLKKRTSSILQDTPPPAHVHFHTEWPRLHLGGLDRLKAWVQEHPQTRLVIVDTLVKLRRRSGSTGANLYPEDYEALEGLKALADEHRIALLVLTHLRKLPADDPLDEVSGTAGMTGAPDTIWILKKERNRGGASLYVVGRDVDEKLLALRFEPSNTSWLIVGDVEVGRLSPERQEIVKVVQEAGRALGPKEIAARLGKGEEAVRYLVWAMRRDGELIQPERGKYVLPDQDSTTNP